MGCDSEQRGEVECGQRSQSRGGMWTAVTEERRYVDSGHRCDSEHMLYDSV